MANIYKKIRENYGLSKAGMSKVFGFGANTWRMYEEGISKAEGGHEKLIRLCMDPWAMRKLVTSNEVVLRDCDVGVGPVKYARLVERIDEILGDYEGKEEAGYREWVEGLYK